MPEQPARRGRVRAALSAFTVQVLLRPVRIGTLALLGGMIGAMVVGAEGWWMLLGIILFQVAACALIVMWVDPTSVRPPPRQLPRVPLLRPRDCPQPATLVRVPRPRLPSPDE